MIYLLDTNAISDPMRTSSAIADWMARLSPNDRAKSAGLVLDENDLWIAATALALGATLVSRDADFAGITGLSVAAVK